jgi:hypothetical protein
MSRECIIKFEGASDADANVYASELRQVLLDASTDITVELRRTNPESQNFGDILQVVLAAPAIVIAAKALTKGLADPPQQCLDPNNNERWHCDSQELNRQGCRFTA